METCLITEDMLLAAKTYLPAAEKAKIIDYVAIRCLDELRVSTDNGESKTPMPPMYKENSLRKARYLLAVLLNRYFGVKYTPVEGDEILPSLDDYDRWMADHPFNRIERMKSSAALKDRCFDILQDYKALEKMLNAEIYGLIQAYNDVVARGMAAIRAFLDKNTLTPEKIKDLEKAQAALEEYLKDRDLAKLQEAAEIEESDHADH